MRQQNLNLALPAKKDNIEEKETKEKSFYITGIYVQKYITYATVLLLLISLKHSTFDTHTHNHLSQERFL